MLFKVGDKVRSITDEVSYFPKGDLATVADASNRDSLQLRPDNIRAYNYKIFYVMASQVERAYDAVDYTLPTLGIPKVQAERKDDGKPLMALLCPVALEGCAAVLAFGAKKYAAHNWQKGMPWSKVIGSLLRHTFKFMSGEDVDAESGLPHVDHILCNAMFMSNYFRRQKKHDDRYKEIQS